MNAATMEFLATIGMIKACLADIQKAADDHIDANLDKIHWGNVVDAKRLLSDLENITAYLNP